MEIIKPLRLGVLTRPFSWRQRELTGVAVLALVSMGDAPVLLHEQELWAALEEDLDEDGVFDLVLPKPHAEFLVSGYAFTAHQADKTCCLVHAQVGDKIRQLRVSGTRYWLPGGATAALPFEYLPLTWGNAFGGPDYPANPLGTGMAYETVNGVQVQRVPHLEWPYQLHTSPRQRPEQAAGLGPIAPDWPQRWHKLGTYDQHWLQTACPGLADNLDWSAFNAAPAEQQWPNLAQLPPGVRYQFANLHPEHALQQGQLPDGQARCFVERSQDEYGEATCFEEVPLRLTTAWFLPHRECVALIYHGCIDALAGGAPSRIMPAFEAANAVHGLAYYQTVMAQRVDADHGDLHIYTDAELISAALLGPGFDTDELGTEPAGPMAEAAQNRLLRLREDMADEALNTHAMPAVPDLTLRRIADLPDYAARLEKQETAWVAEAHAGKAQLLAETASSKADPSALAGLAEDPAPAAPFDFAGRAAAIRDGFAGADHAANAANLLAQLRATYLASAQYCGAAVVLAATDAALIRAQVAQRYAQDRDLGGWDLTGADLHGMDLRGANLSGALLENANLSACQLDHATLIEAVLVRAQLHGASLRNTQCAGSNFSHVRADAACWDGADLQDTEWLNAILDECSLNGVSLSGRLHNMMLMNCDLQHAELSQLDCIEVELIGADLHGAQMSDVTWLDSVWQGVHADGMALDDCNFSNVNANGTDFSAASVLGSSFGLGSTLEECNFSGATLTDCNLRDVPMVRCNLAAATLKDCDVSGANLTGADLRQAQAQGLLAQGTQFSAALMQGMNLMQAMLNRADLRASNLHSANLFEADLGEAWLDASTILDQVHSGRTQSYPLRKVEA